MSVPLESYLNFCESLIKMSIAWLGDPQAQERDWDNLPPPLRAPQVIIEHFLESCEEIFDLDYFQKFESLEPFVLLKDLYDQIKSYNSNPKSMFNVLEKEKLLSDSKWIEIQHLALETQKALEKFIKENRLNEKG